MWDLQTRRHLISGPETIPRFEAIKKNLGYVIEKLCGLFEIVTL